MPSLQWPRSPPSPLGRNPMKCGSEEFSVNRVEDERQHDRAPLFDRRISAHLRFRPASSALENGFVPKPRKRKPRAAVRGFRIGKRGIGGNRALHRWVCAFPERFKREGHGLRSRPQPTKMAAAIWGLRRPSLWRCPRGGNLPSEAQFYMHVLDRAAYR
jgi:hypothetical protein